MIRKNQKISLDKFINFCLYDKKVGYYMTKNPFGKMGDFTTAPNISRLFSEMIAIWTVSFWKSLGSPKKFNLIELGGGNGEMMKVMIESFQKFPSFFKSCNIFIIEKSPKLIKIQKKNINFKNIKWKKKITNFKKFPSIFLANEFFDALPIKQFEKFKNHWYERFVTSSNENKIIFIRKKIDLRKLEKKINTKISSNQNFIEFSPLTSKYLENIFKIIKKQNGGLLIIDYGYFAKHMKNTLQAIHEKKYSNVLENIGKSDITYNINFSMINNIVKKFKNLKVNYTTQQKFLINLGINQRAEIISKNKTFYKKADLFFRLKRLTDKKEMGEIFKVMLIKSTFNKSRIGF